jgi:hypothetical protein
MATKPAKATKASALKETKATSPVKPTQSTQEGAKIVLQVGAEFRIRNNGDLIMDNPELELEGQDFAADAILLYRFDPSSGEHILRLLDPVADHQHIKVHRRDD